MYTFKERTTEDVRDKTFPLQGPAGGPNVLVVDSGRTPLGRRVDVGITLPKKDDGTVDADIVRTIRVWATNDEKAAEKVRNRLNAPQPVARRTPRSDHTGVSSSLLDMFEVPRLRRRGSYGRGPGSRGYGGGAAL